METTEAEVDAELKDTATKGVYSVREFLGTFVFKVSKIDRKA
jgi:hypothetical protein